MDMEAEMLRVLNGKFFWEPTTDPSVSQSNEDVNDIRKAQREFAGKVTNIRTGFVREIAYTEPKAQQRHIFRGEEKQIEPIVNAISKVYGVEVDDLFKNSTSQRISPAKRHLWWALMRYIPGATLPEIGRLTKKNHTTILHGKQTFQKNMDMQKLVEVERELGLI